LSDVQIKAHLGLQGRPKMAQKLLYANNFIKY